MRFWLHRKDKIKFKYFYSFAITASIHTTSTLVVVSLLIHKNISQRCTIEIRHFRGNPPKPYANTRPTKPRLGWTLSCVFTKCNAMKIISHGGWVALQTGRMDGGVASCYSANYPRGIRHPPHSFR